MDESVWTPIAIQYVADYLADELAALGVDLPVAEVSDRFTQPLHSSEGIGWSVDLAEPASVVVVSFAARGNSIILDADEYGGELDWTNAGPGTVHLPGGNDPDTWDMQFEARGLEFAAVILLPPGTDLADFRGLKDAILIGYKNAKMQSAINAKNMDGSTINVQPIQYPGLLILPYEVEP